MRWADELDGSTPLPALEPFFILAALELGDPDSQHEWAKKNAFEFHQLYCHYLRGAESSNTLPDVTSALIQYMIWYPREASRLNSGKA